MSYKTVFTALTDFDPAFVDVAVSLAKAQDAHLDVLCVGLDQMRNTYLETGANPMIVQAALEEAEKHSDTLRQMVTSRLAGDSLRWDVSKCIWAFSGIERSVAVRSRFSDLAIVRKPYVQNSGVEAAYVLEGLLLQGDCATLVVPESYSYKAPSRIVIAWNESAQALRAVRAAIPFLKQATQVQIAVVDPTAHSPERSDPGGPLAVYLSRHGIECDVHVLASGGKSASDKLIQHCTEQSADMMVMGGYGHSRFREAILGGATRDMLERAPIPVLMSH